MTENGNSPEASQIPSEVRQIEAQRRVDWAQEEVDRLVRALQAAESALETARAEQRLLTGDDSHIVRGDVN